MGEPERMTVALFTHPDCRVHNPGSGHPESPGRIDAVLASLEGEGFLGLDRRVAPLATVAQLELAHTPAHVARLVDASEPAPGRRVALDPDTMLGPGSVTAARRAAGAACAAVDAVMDGSASAAFAAVRPPGHHAEPATAMGFCLFGSVAIAALHARTRWSVRRIAIADFDVHHGNGTQAIVEGDPDILFVSSHQHPCYPGTGMADERGVADNVVNLPLPPGTGSTGFRRAWSERGLPAIDAFAPELILVSAGFDAHTADPLASLELGEADFTWITERLIALADRHGAGRLVSVLEGGYDLAALGRSAASHVRALLLRH